MSAPTMEELDALDSAAILDRLRGIEAARRQLEHQEVLLLAQVTRRGMAAEHGCKNTVDFLRYGLRIGARDAAARVRLAEAVAPRRMVTGTPVAPAHPLLADALAAGQVSARAVLTIAQTVDRLPDCVLEAGRPAVETVLLDFAKQHDPETLARHAHAVAARLDQDGAYRDLERAARRREMTLRRHPDGSGTLSGEVTCELAEYLQTLFDTLAKPQPAADGALDARSPGQRRHDALLSGMRLLFASGRLPDCHGRATLLTLTMDVHAFGTGDGVARTGHGITIPAAVAKSWLDPEAGVILVLLSKTKGIEAYSSTQRLFTEQQRLAMAARDRGCSYWGCDAPASWAEAHHVTDYAVTHRTRVDDGALACSANHRTFEKMGWRSTMINGWPHWVPPDWIDPDQTPRRNTLHDY